jgi:hypothetical protein
MLTFTKVLGLLIGMSVRLSFFVLCVYASLLVLNYLGVTV